MLSCVVPINKPAHINEGLTVIKVENTRFECFLLKVRDNELSYVTNR